jgi:hypothetical protein
MSSSRISSARHSRTTRGSGMELIRLAGLVGLELLDSPQRDPPSWSQTASAKNECAEKPTPGHAKDGFRPCPPPARQRGRTEGVGLVAADGLIRSERRLGAVRRCDRFLELRHGLARSRCVTLWLGSLCEVWARLQGYLYIFKNAFSLALSAPVHVKSDSTALFHLLRAARGIVSRIDI